MVLPAELLTYEAPEKPVINLKVTFSDLSSQGWLALAFTALAFGLMVTDAVGECHAQVRCMIICIFGPLVKLEVPPPCQRFTGLHAQSSTSRVRA